MVGTCLKMVTCDATNNKMWSDLVLRRMYALESSTDGCSFTSNGVMMCGSVASLCLRCACSRSWAEHGALDTKVSRANCDWMLKSRRSRVRPAHRQALKQRVWVLYPTTNGTCVGYSSDVGPSFFSSFFHLKHWVKFHVVVLRNHQSTTDKLVET